LTKKEKEAMKKLIIEKRARLSLKTTGILKSIMCGRAFLPISYLRKNPKDRNILFYKLGEMFIDKELDLANIIKKIRTLNFFMKMVLDTDQRKLLKLRSSKLIETDIDMEKSI
jgi:hypothetical protein